MIGVDEKLPWGTIRGVVSIKELNGEPELYGLLILCMRCFVADRGIYSRKFNFFIDDKEFCTCFPPNIFYPFLKSSPRGLKGTKKSGEF